MVRFLFLEEHEIFFENLTKYKNSLVLFIAVSDEFMFHFLHSATLEAGKRFDIT